MVFTSSKNRKDRKTAANSTQNVENVAACGGQNVGRRVHGEVLRVASTIADLEGSDHIKRQHPAEAVGYRSLDRCVWT
jgi:predicted ATPase with chaperone activity